MCGILGLVINQQSTFRRSEFRPLIERLFLLSESRGKDASGLALVTPAQIAVFKRPVRARALIRSKEYRVLFSQTHYASSDPLVVMGHARMVTNGHQETHENNQPVIKHGLVCLHNGIVVNDGELWSQFPAMNRDFEVDTEIIISLVHTYCQQGHSLIDAVITAYRQIQGANSIALLSADTNAIVLASSNGSLYYARGQAGNELVFASENYILEQALRHRALRALFSTARIVHIAPKDGYAFVFDDLQPRYFKLGAVPQPNPPLPRCEPIRSISDRKPAAGEKRLPEVVTPGFFRGNDAYMATVNRAVRTLKRCTRCLLPETFPFIRYNESGVCNYCDNYQPIPFKGHDSLETLVAPSRSSAGDPDCLVPISGGRDSCFGLHYVKNVLKMNPVAYTYDWGMVTDLARRNISRMCGQLGIEHILISADIKTKRENIGKNVAAWLKKPDLGTVPLFMAGDKQFFYYANKLKQQMRLGIVLFNINPLERTDFKVGFCGINKTHHREKFYYSLSFYHQIRLALYYAQSFLRNPAFLNSSLFDSLFAFVSYYLIPKDYAILYHYIRWDEKLIVDTLLNEYDWETATDTDSTWRIGDGTASFYNYIYYVMAGFTENDTLRSNQIREGMITREEAMDRLEQDNQPRYESMQWYCNTIGVDVRAAIQTINAAPKRYSMG